MKRNFLPRLLVDVDSSNFLALLTQELNDANPVLLQFVIEETGIIEEITEKERTLLAALIGLKTLGASDKNDPDYIEISERSIKEAQQQTCDYTLRTVNTEGIHWAEEKIKGVNCGLNSFYGRKKETVQTYKILSKVYVFFRAYEIERQRKKE